MVALTSYTSGLPDPFAVATINGEQTKTTSVARRTLNPYWNESFDLYVCFALLYPLDLDGDELSLI